MSEVFRNDTEVYLLEIYKISYVGREIFKLNVSVATLIGNFVSHVEFESLLQPNVRVAYALLAISLPTSGSKKSKIFSHGGLAQLGEHLPCTQGVKSSSLLISTIDNTWCCRKLNRSLALVKFHCTLKIAYRIDINTKLRFVPEKETTFLMRVLNEQRVKTLYF